MLGADRTILRPVFSHCGALLTALSIFTTHSAQAGSPALTVIHNFGISDGADPLAGLAMSHSKVLYGSTSAGGTAGDGVVFSLTPPAAPGGSWTEQVLYNIGSSPGDGVTPYGGVAIGAGGVVYGTTFTGGTGTCSIPFDPTGCGTVFSLTPPASPGGAWTEQVLYSFSNGTDGRYPVAGVGDRQRRGPLRHHRQRRQRPKWFLQLRDGVLADITANSGRLVDGGGALQLRH